MVLKGEYKGYEIQCNGEFFTIHKDGCRVNNRTTQSLDKAQEWLKGLPLLKPTSFYPPRIVDGKQRWGNQCDSGQNNLGPSDDRWKERSRTYQGIADALAEQYGGEIKNTIQGRLF